MNKTLLIIQREYLTRVKKKSFIVMTFLTPILVTLLLFLPLWLAGLKDSETKHVAVVDRTGKYEAAFQPNESYYFDLADAPVDSFREKKDYYAIVVISADLSLHPDAVTIYSESQVNLEFKSYLSGILKHYVENEKLEQYNIPGLNEMIKNARTDIQVKTVKWSNDGTEQETSSEMALIIGMVATFLIYFFILVYGAMVMRGVVEEKTNRIVEIIISSVKPFQLMIGKITGIALVGLTQFCIWLFLLFFISTLAGSWVDSAQTQNVMFQPLAANNDMLFSVLNFNWGEIIFFFLVYFIGGYLLYASLFAAIGAASDTETDTQQFMLPITLPIIFGLYAAIYSVNNPDGPLAFWSSIIPFTSPIVMMVRIPLGVPVWQLILSVSVLIFSFILTTWLAGKIYRTGILMYGKKIGYKEIWKWLKYK